MKVHARVLLPLLVMLGGSVTVGWLTALGLEPLPTRPFAVLGPLPGNEFGAVLGERISRARLSSSAPILIAGASLTTLDPAQKELVRAAFVQGRPIIVTEADQAIVDDLMRMTQVIAPLEVLFNEGEPTTRAVVGLIPHSNGISTYQLHTAATGRDLEDQVTGLMSWVNQGSHRIHTHWAEDASDSATDPDSIKNERSVNLARVARHYQEVDQFTTPLGFLVNTNTHAVLYSCADDAYFIPAQSDLRGDITGIEPTVLQTFRVDRNNALEIAGLSVEQTLPESTEFASDYHTGATLTFPGSVDYFDFEGNVATAPIATYVTDRMVQSGAVRIKSQACVEQAFPEVEFTAQSDPDRSEFRFAVSWVWRIPGSVDVPALADGRLQFLTSDDANRSGFSINTLGMTLRFPARRCGSGEGGERGTRGSGDGGKGQKQP